MSQVKKLPLDSHEKDPEKFKESLEEFVNKPHIEPVIDHLIYHHEKPVQTDKHGELLYSAICWNSNNLVKGPEPKNRADDPGSKIDEKILDRQSDEYKKCFEPFKNNNQTFDDFVNLPPTKPVEWSENSGKYVVQVTLKYINMIISRGIDLTVRIHLPKYRLEQKYTHRSKCLLPHNTMFSATLFVNFSYFYHVWLFSGLLSRSPK